MYASIYNQYIVNHLTPTERPKSLVLEIILNNNNLESIFCVTCIPVSIYFKINTHFCVCVSLLYLKHLHFVNNDLKLRITELEP